MLKLWQQDQVPSICCSSTTTTTTTTKQQHHVLRKKDEDLLLLRKKNMMMIITKKSKVVRIILSIYNIMILLSTISFALSPPLQQKKPTTTTKTSSSIIASSFSFSTRKFITLSSSSSSSSQHYWAASLPAVALHPTNKIDDEKYEDDDYYDDNNDSIPIDFFKDYKCKWINNGKDIVVGGSSLPEEEDNNNNNNKIDQLLEYYDFTIEPFQVSKGGGGGFCNKLYQVQNSTHTLLLKEFSKLAQERMALMSSLSSSSSSSELLLIDERLGEYGLGPKIIQSYLPNALLMEFLPDPILTEYDLFQFPPNQQLLQNIGKALYSLHHVQIIPTIQLQADDDPFSKSSSLTANNHDSINIIPRNKNMLWRSIDLLLDRISSPKSKSYFENEVCMHKTRLEVEFNLPMVPFGHGDCKPSNIILLNNNNNNNNDDNTTNTTRSKNNNVRFLDLELTGYNYRAYDLSKLLFRRSTSSDILLQSQCQDYVLRSYLGMSSSSSSSSSSTSSSSSPSPSSPTVTDADDTKTKDAAASTSSIASLKMEEELEKLRLECQLLLPMTWLEAALFFEATKDIIAKEEEKEEGGGGGRSRKRQQEWNIMAQDRLENYHKACQSTVYLESIDSYRKIIQQQKKKEKVGKS